MPEWCKSSRCHKKATVKIEQHGTFGLFVTFACDDHFDPDWWEQVAAREGSTTTKFILLEEAQDA